MNILDEIWNQVEKCEEPAATAQSVIDVYETIIFSSYYQFKDIRNFVENVEIDVLESAIWSIQMIPSMEAGEDDSYNEGCERYHLYGNLFREYYLIYEFQKDIWSKAKPKKKRFF